MLIPALGIVFGVAVAAMFGGMVYDLSTSSPSVARVPPPAYYASVQTAPSDEAALHRFVLAHRRIAELREEYEPLIRMAPSPERADALRRQARQRMQAAIADAGMTVAQYNAFVRTARVDESFRSQVAAAMLDAY